MKKGQELVRIIEVMGYKSATICKVEKVTKKCVTVVDSSIQYDPDTLTEIDPPMAGIRSYLVEFDG